MDPGSTGNGSWNRLGWDLVSSCKVSAKPKNGPAKKKRGWGGAAQPPPLRIQIRTLVEKACGDKQGDVGMLGVLLRKATKARKTQTKMVSPPCAEVQEPPGRNKQRWIRGRRGTGPGARPAFFRARSGLGWDLVSSCKVSAKPKNGPTKKKRGWGGAAQPPPK